jgi:hypothetical protein
MLHMQALPNPQRRLDHYLNVTAIETPDSSFGNITTGIRDVGASLQKHVSEPKQVPVQEDRVSRKGEARLQDWMALAFPHCRYDNHRLLKLFEHGQPKGETVVNPIMS